MSVGTEHGFAISFGNQGGSYCLQQIAGHREVVDVIEKTGHCTTGNRKYMSGDLKAFNSFQVTVQFDGTDGLPEIGADAETITITHPKAKDETGGATIVGTGFISEREFPGGTAGGTGLKTAILVIQWDGETPPAFTPATTT